jgi:hypothetical protein
MMAKKEIDLYKYSVSDFILLAWCMFWMAIAPTIWVKVIFFVIALMPVATIHTTWLLRARRKELAEAIEQAKEDEKCTPD